LKGRKLWLPLPDIIVVDLTRLLALLFVAALVVVVDCLSDHDRQSSKAARRSSNNKTKAADDRPGWFALAKSLAVVRRSFLSLTTVTSPSALSTSSSRGLLLLPPLASPLQASS
jgi:hypothetical protein